jgi:signal transduction histidine kinase
MATVPTLMTPWLKRQLTLVIVMALVGATGISLVSDTSFPRVLLYSLCISASCSVGAQVLHELVARLRGGDRLTGLPLIIVVVIGALPGYQIGYWIADALTGVRSPTVFDASPRQLAFLIFVVAIPSIAASYYFRSREQLAHARSQAAEHQLQLLQAQLEPHMLFNTLANLRVLIRQDPQRAQAMLDQLISFLRATLQASRSGSHSLADEFARLNDYLALMKVRMQDRLRPSFDLPDELTAAQIPPLLLQPLVENAIKHGLEPQVDGGELIVSARRDGEALILEVRDTGAGLSTPSSEGTHFGLHQIRERLATRYGADTEFTLTQHPEGGALARIRIKKP